MAVVPGDMIVEDGTGLIDANSYVDIAYVDEYHRLRDNTLWADSDDNDKASSIIRASQYIDERFTFRGSILNPEDQDIVPGTPDGPQGLQWARVDVWNRNGVDVSETVPIEIEQATAEYALRILGDGTGKVDLQPDPDTGEEGKTVSSKREKVGPIEEETKYDTSMGIRTVQPYPFADSIIWKSGFAINAGTAVVR